MAKFPEQKLVNKQSMKRMAKKCTFCDEERYVVLDVHRIVPGEKGGRYTPCNTVVCCSNCHRMIHDGEIIIDKYYDSSTGKVLRCIIDGKEIFL